MFVVVVVVESNRFSHIPHTNLGNHFNNNNLDRQKPHSLRKITTKENTMTSAVPRTQKIQVKQEDHVTRREKHLHQLMQALKSDASSTMIHNEASSLGYPMNQHRSNNVPETKMLLNLIHDNSNGMYFKMHCNNNEWQ